MTEPSPHYLVGEQLDPETVKRLAAHYRAMRGDGINIVKTAERGLRFLGLPVESAVLTRKERRSFDNR